NLFLLIMTIPSIAFAQEKIAFTISFSEPQAHYIDVEMELTGFSGEYLDLKMPVWSPGSYLIREYPKNVESFSARGGDNKPLGFNKVNKNTWRVQANNADRVIVRYRVYAFEVSVRTSFVDESHAFLSPTGTFMYVADRIDLPAEVEIVPSENWSQISTGLEA